MNELKRIISKYLLEDSVADTYSDFSQEEVNKLFKNMKSYECPDILSFYDNKIVAIEHFEFDSFKNTSGGSDYRIQEGRIEQKMNKSIETELEDKKEIWLHDTIKNTSSLEQYYNNFKKVLLNHLDKVPSYKEHIINDFGNKQEIEFWFFAEDVTPLGCYSNKKGEPGLGLLLPLSKENIEILRRHKEIKGLIFGIYAMNKYKLILMYNDDKTLNNLEKNEILKVEESEFLVFETQTTGFALLIPKEEKGAEVVNE